jgi:hypothetical protein
VLSTLHPQLRWTPATPEQHSKRGYCRAERGQQAPTRLRIVRSVP